MKILPILTILLISCNQSPKQNALEQDNIRLQKQVDSLSNELYKCDMLIKSYERDPLHI